MDAREHLGLVGLGVAELEAVVLVESEPVGDAAAELVFLGVFVVIGEGDDLGGVPEADGWGARTLDEQVLEEVLCLTMVISFRVLFQRFD